MAEYPEVPRARRTAAIREVLGTDYTFIARWVALHQNKCKCDPPPSATDDEIWWFGLCATCGGRAVDGFDAHQLGHLLGHGEAKAAISMKYAVKKDFAHRTRRRDDEARAIWTPTLKAAQTFPRDQAHVMPDPEEAVTEAGVFRGFTPEERAATTRRLREQQGLGPGDTPQLPPVKDDG